MNTSMAMIEAGETGDDIEAAIRREHEAASSAYRTALDHALECGRLLAQAREGIAHGGWESFVRDRCGISERTARMYLRLDANRGRLANRQHVAGLTVREAVRELTVPKVEAEAEGEDAMPLVAPEWYRPNHSRGGRRRSMTGRGRGQGGGTKRWRRFRLHRFLLTRRRKTPAPPSARWPRRPEHPCTRPVRRSRCRRRSRPASRPNHSHGGRHPSGWCFKVWPHPHGEPWSHFIVCSAQSGYPGEEGGVLSGPKHGIRSDALIFAMERQCLSGMPPLDDPGWEIGWRPVEAEVIAAEPFYNSWLFRDEADYRQRGMSIEPSQKPHTRAMA